MTFGVAELILLIRNVIAGIIFDHNKIKKVPFMLALDTIYLTCINWAQSFPI